MTGRLIAAVFACAAFAAAVVYGVSRGAGVSDVLTGALLVLIACYAVGLIVGRVAQACVVDHVRRYEQANPIPQEPDLALAEPGAVSGAEPAAEDAFEPGPTVRQAA